MTTGARVSASSFKSHVGMGSSEQDFVGDEVMIFFTLSTESGSNE